MTQCFAFRSFPYNLTFKSAKLEWLNADVSPANMFRVLRAVVGGNLVIIDQSLVGKLVCIMTRFYKPAGTRLVIPEFIFGGKSNLKSRLSLQFWRVFLASVDKVVILSDYEIGYYAQLFRQPPQKFHRIYFYADSDGQNIGPSPDGYVFSSGRTERDFVTLVKALRSLKMKSVVVADGRYRNVFQELPENIEVFFDLSYEKYKHYLMNSRLVVVPLFPGPTSRGQSTIMEAKKYGKPLLCADIPFIREHFFNDFDGMIYYTPGNADQLRDRICGLLSDSNKLNEIGRCNFSEYTQYFNLNRFKDDYEALITELTSK